MNAMPLRLSTFINLYQPWIKGHEWSSLPLATVAHGLTVNCAVKARPPAYYSGFKSPIPV